MTQAVWVLAETGPEGLRTCTLEALGEGRSLADSLRVRLGLVLAGSSLQASLTQARSADADHLFLLESPALSPFISSVWTAALEPLFRQHRPALILCSASPNGQELAGCLAARLGLELVSGCTWVKTAPDNSLRFVRPVLGGQAQETLSASPGCACLATLVPGAVGVALPANPRQPRETWVSVDDSRLPCHTRRVDYIPGDPATMDLREAELIVAGGRGAVQSGGWKRVEELAAVLGASLGGSRQALDLGAIPPERMVGQTGKIVSPRLYLAAGISGVMHHLGGVQAGHLVAVNSDRAAPIFRSSSLGVVGNLNEILPLLVERIRSLGENPTGKAS